MNSINPELQERAKTALEALLTDRRTRPEWLLLRSHIDALDEAFQQGNALTFARCYADISTLSETTSVFGTRSTPANTDTVSERDRKGDSDSDNFRIRGANTWDRERDEAVRPPDEIYELINKMVHTLAGVSPMSHAQDSEKPEHDAQ